VSVLDLVILSFSREAAVDSSVAILCFSDTDIAPVVDRRSGYCFVVMLSPKKYSNARGGGSKEKTAMHGCRRGSSTVAKEITKTHTKPTYSTFAGPQICYVLMIRTRSKYLYVRKTATKMPHSLRTVRVG
jgi:hypothetical protein